MVSKAATRQCIGVDVSDGVDYQWLTTVGNPMAESVWSKIIDRNLSRDEHIQVEQDLSRGFSELWYRYNTWYLGGKG